MRRFLPLLLLAVCGVLVDANSLRNPFVYDDIDSIVHNPNLRSLWPPSTALAAPAGSGASGRPLVALSLAVNHAFGGLDPVGYHVFNLIVHVLAAWTLFVLVRGTLLAPRYAGAFGARAAPIALATALLWLVHPLHTAVQDHVVYRNESMAALCLLLVLECVRRLATGGDRRWAVAAVLANAAGMACKETMVAAPLLALLYDRTFFAGSWRAALGARRGTYAGLAVGWFVLAACVATGDRGASVTQSFADVTRLDYARTQLGVVAHYLRLAFWPRPLVLDYDWQVARGFRSVALPGLLVGALGLGTVLACVRRSGWGVLGAVFFLVLAPSSSFVPLTGAIAADHRMYLPLATVVMAVVLAVERTMARAGVLRTATGRGLASAALVVAVLLLGLAARARHRDWATAVEIWRVTANSAPRNPRAHANLGAALVEAGELDAAIAALETALRLQPDIPAARANLATAHRLLGLREAASGSQAAAVAHLDSAIRLQPNDAVALNALAWVLATTPDSTLRDPAAALVHANRALAALEARPPEFLDTLAAARAAAGDCDGAAIVAREAEALARSSGKLDLASKIAARAALYASGHSYREARAGAP